MKPVHLILTVATFGILLLCVQAKEPKESAKKAKAAEPSPWAPFVETNFPFFSSVLDARDADDKSFTNNLTPRGLILNLGHDRWACFDVDLLRVSAIWQGKGVTPVSMSQISYQIAGAKAPDGQEKLPHMDGSPWLVNGIYPGWQVGHNFTFSDPRPECPTPSEVGRGPLPLTMGRFQAVRFEGTGVRLEYQVDGISIAERIRVGESGDVFRQFEIPPHSQSLAVVLGKKVSAKAELQFNVQAAPQARLVTHSNAVSTLEIPASSKPLVFSVSLSLAVDPGVPGTLEKAKPRWPAKVQTRGLLSTATNEAYVLDDIAPPLANPWKRNVRLADIAFFRDGRAAAVTFDGDVWLIDGLNGDLTNVVWKRFASGLQEPLGLCIRREEIFVFDRNGIWRLRDTDGDGEAELHELFSNQFTQTAETREYANGMKLAPDGSFVIAKGGQQASTIGCQNGSVLRVAADGKTTTTLAWGLRQPFIGVNPVTGQVTASDQQGHYVPATPIHIIGDNQYYGFLSELLPKEKYPAPIADPLTWVPHSINASGASQVWLSNARMGPLNGALLHIGYYRPELFLILPNNRGSRPQASILSLAKDFSFPPLNAAVNPVDGQLYLVGFQIWGTVAKNISGLARLRYTGAPSLNPREVVPMQQGVLLKFDVPLDPNTASNPDNYSVELWNYQRASTYGSPHFKLDGSKGQDTLAASAAYLSTDHKSVFVAVPGMKLAMQLRVGWAIKSAAGTAINQNIYTTPYSYPTFTPPTEGFGDIRVDLTPRTKMQQVKVPVTVAEGERLASLMGCAACHSADGSTLGKVGPSWKGLFGSEQVMVSGAKVTADENYLRESIRLPNAKIVKGYDKSDAGMPSYEGVLTDAQIEALVLYIKSL